MTIIDEDVVVAFGDGRVVFEEPGLNDWAILTQLAEKTLEEQADLVIPKIKSVENLFYSDKSPVSLESLKAKKFSARFFVKLVREWSAVILKSLQTGTEGNVQTGA